MTSFSELYFRLPCPSHTSANQDQLMQYQILSDTFEFNLHETTSVKLPKFQIQCSSMSSERGTNNQRFREVGIGNQQLLVTRSEHNQIQLFEILTLPTDSLRSLVFCKYFVHISCNMKQSGITKRNVCKEVNALRMQICENNGLCGK